VFVLADAGPHGYLSIAAHAHADALSFTLSAGGKAILIDPGTYTYHTEERWRRYFRGTRAHNTVVIDDLDQSTQAGPFLWTRKARTRVRDWKPTDSGARLVASHDGYARVGVIHQRSWELQGSTLTIMETLQGKGSHRVMLCFQVAPDCRVEQISESVFMITHADVHARLTLPDNMESALIRGGEEAGWYSPVFGVKQATFSILARRECPVPSSFKTVVEVNP
jgi:uncharacterized heparinase superfamily protein